MGKTCGRLVDRQDAVSAGQHFASVLKETAVYIGQVMDRSWVNYYGPTNRLLGGRGDFFLPALRTLVAVSVCLDISYLRYVLLIARQ